MKTSQFFFIAASCISNANASDKDPSPRISNQPPAPPQVSVSKCCPAQQSLNMSNPKHPVCIKAKNVSSPFIAMRGLNMDDNFLNRTEEVKIQLTQDQENPHPMPHCFSDFEVHRIEHSVTDNVRDTWITVEGKLVTSRYEAEFDHGDFCIDREVMSGGVVAVMCDACKKGIPCINLCCPHGYAFLDNPDYDDEDYDYSIPPKICKKKEDGLNYNPTLWDHNDKVFLENWEKNEDFLLVGPKLIPENASISHYFECPKDTEKKEAGGLTFAATDLGTFYILINGKLQGKDIPNTMSKEKTTKVWNSDNYCAILILPTWSVTRKKSAGVKSSPQPSTPSCSASPPSSSSSHF